jgi:hypothetical protein
LVKKFHLFHNEVDLFLANTQVDVNAHRIGQTESEQDDSPLFYSIRTLVNHMAEKLLSSPRIKTKIADNSALYSLYSGALDLEEEIPTVDNDPDHEYSTLPILAALMNHFVKNNSDKQFSSYYQVIETMFEEDGFLEVALYPQEDGGIQFNVFQKTDGQNKVLITVSLTKDFLEENIDLSARWTSEILPESSTVMELNNSSAASSSSLVLASSAALDSTATSLKRKREDSIEEKASIEREFKGKNKSSNQN